MKNLVIVESPAKAKTIEKFLGSDYKVMSSFGHIRDLRKRGMSVDISGGFTPEYEIPSDKKDLVKKLKSAAADADVVWLASDEDREGEAIAWHLYEVLGLKPERTHRIVFHEITKPAIIHAIENPRNIDIDRVNAQQARRVLDRIVGFELSPILWKKIKPALSAGRVQSVALRLVCEREKDVEAFVSDPFYRLNATFAAPDGKIFKAECPKRLEKEEQAIDFLNSCRGANWRVASVQRKPGVRKPAPPFTTSTLQQEASRKLGFSVSTTMRVAQKLYEEGHITYMRTDSTNLSELALRDIASEITSEYGDSYLALRRWHTSSKGAQEAHEAIRPTYVSRSEIDGQPQEKRLYDLIRKRALASQMADAKIDRTLIEIESPDVAESFRSQGETLVFAGFMKAYAPSDAEGKEVVSDSAILPPLKAKDAVSAQEIVATERFTQAPARYTEASLVKRMEELGIGRPSTYAPTISTLLTREYISRGDHEGTPRQYAVLTLSKDDISRKMMNENVGSTRGRLVPTDVGIVVCDFLTENFPDILDYGFTARVEEKFDEIAEGKLPWRDEMSQFYDGFHPYIEKVEAMRTDHKVGERVLGVDPGTGRRVSVKIGRFGPVVQIGEATDEEKPLFASLSDGMSIRDITLEEALKLFELPRKVGEFEGKEVSAAIGRFGPYIKHDKMFVSIPAELSPRTITIEEAEALILAKREQEANKVIKTFEELPGVEVLRGRFGPYIAYKPEGAKKSVNYKIPKTVAPESLTAAGVKELMEAQDAAPKKSRARKK